MKVKKWMEKWFDLYVRPFVRDSTYHKYHQIAKNHILPYIGDKELSQIKNDVLQDCLCNKLHCEKGLSDSTINLIRSVLKLLFEAAFENNLVSQNPCLKLKRFSVEEKKVDAFTKQEQSKIEKYILTKKNKKLYGVVITLYTGMRIGELLALTWDNVDFKRNIITVCQTVSYKEFAKPKTKAGIREIPISQFILPLLKELRQSSACEYVIETKGHSTEIRGYQGLFSRLLKKLNIRPLGFHSLRHTFATRAIECGVDYKTLSVLMGHANAMITINRYTHSMMETKRKAIQKMSKMNSDN